MNCDMTSFSTFETQKLPPLVQQSLNSNLLYIMSKTLTENFKLFCGQKDQIYRHVPSTAKKRLPKEHFSNSMLIDLCSDEKEDDENFKATGHFEDEKLNSEGEEELKNHFSDKLVVGMNLQISNNSEKQKKVTKQIWKKSFFPIPEACPFEGHCEVDESYLVDCNASCPSIGVTNEELLRKKQCLQRRHVDVWQPHSHRGRRCRREIRNLQH